MSGLPHANGDEPVGGQLLQLENFGNKLPHEDVERYRNRVADLLDRRSRNFPGAQPVSFSKRHFHELEREDYYLCEKTDGIRCLLYLSFVAVDDAPNGQIKANFLIDRKNDYYYINKPLDFPLPGKGPDSYHQDTLLDGELVLDVERDGTRTKRYLVFDCLALDNRPLLDRPFNKRIGYATENILDPYKKLLRAQPARRREQPFEVQIKELQKAYGTEMMFRQTLPSLKHGNDGLVFTCVSAQYVTGTDPHIIKWKPPHENTIDFRLQIGSFPTLSDTDPEMDANDPDAEEPDYDACPHMSLLVNHGSGDNKHFADLHVTDAEWTAVKNLSQMLDGRIIECYRDAVTGHWRPKIEHHNGAPRFRDDKTQANHITTVQSVLESIEDAVTEQDLIAKAKPINVAWKEREKKVNEEKARFENERRARAKEQEESRRRAERLREQEGDKAGAGGDDVLASP